MKNWKKSLLLVLSAAVLSLVYALGGGADQYKGAIIIGVAPQHATRIEIIYKSSNGKLLERSTHQSETVTDGITTINPHDYLSGYCGTACKPYGAIPGHEVEFQKNETLSKV